MNNLKYQTGLSLIELMVAMVISSFLIIGVTQIYIDNKKSYAFQQNLSENQEGSRFALLTLQSELNKAGYRRRPDESMENAFPTDNVSGCDFVAGEIVKSISASSICIRYQPRDPTDRDCLGNTVTIASNFSNPYTEATEIFTERLSINSKDELICTRNTTSAALIGNVLDLRFEYGIGSATAPQTISSYITDATLQPILAVRYTALLRSSNNNLREKTDVDTALNNWKALTGASPSEVTAMKDLDKGQLYQVSQNTVMLRNRMP